MANTNNTNTSNTTSQANTAGSNSSGGTTSTAGTNSPAPAASAANTQGKEYEVVNPTSTALNLYIKEAGGFVDIPAEGKSKPLMLTKEAHAAVKQSLNKRPAVRIQEVKKEEDKG